MSDATEPLTPAAEPKLEPKPPSNLAIRLATAGVLVPIILALMYLAPWWAFIVFVAVGCAIGSFELFSMTIPKDRLLQTWGLLASLGVFGTFVFVKDVTAVFVAFLSLTFVALLSGLLRPDPIESSASRIAWLLGGPLYVGGLIAFIAKLHLLEHGPSWVLLSMMLAWFGDTGGYFAGRFLGKHKLYERVSPKKTIEGSIGSLGGSVLGALFAHFVYLPSLPLVDGILLALVAGALGQAGDLCESLIKRSTGVKDSGFVIPGHGGLLDRIDALLFTAAATWIYAAWIAP